MAPKSILKKSKDVDYVGENSDKDREHNYQVALHHANLLQDRKNVEADILAAIEILIDFPTGSNASAAQPQPDDVVRFRGLMVPFQSSDFDDLIEERHATNKCGYVFCPNITKHSGPGARRIIWGSNKDTALKTVPSEMFDAWCSRDCAKRAMYIKAQLSEKPAWERQDSGNNQIELLDDPKSESDLSRQMDRLGIGDSRDTAKLQDVNVLARERGDEHNARPKYGVMKDILAENANIRPPDIPRSDSSSHATIEGYAPRFDPHNVSNTTEKVSGDEDLNLDLY